jgi:hypothetical protein
VKSEKRKAKSEKQYPSSGNKRFALKTIVYICLTPLVYWFWLKYKLEKTVWHIPLGLFEPACTGYLHLAALSKIEGQTGSKTGNDGGNEQGTFGAFGVY